MKGSSVFCNPTLRVIAVGRRVIPRVVFTDPQIAVVGLTEQEGIAAGHDCWCNTLPMSLASWRDSGHARHHQDGGC